MVPLMVDVVLVTAHLLPAPGTVGRWALGVRTVDAGPHLGRHQKARGRVESQAAGNRNRISVFSKLEIGTYFIVVVVVKEEVVVVMEEEMVVIVVVVAAVIEVEVVEVVVVEEEDVVVVVPALKRISKCATRLCFPALSQENR